ncbi:phosphoribosylformylglycinamidine synthase subunit PurL [Pararhizobium mangrovi]|uniref:Phosphoribosylformylglycinamidine synthase subunit PurL n=1 Tax=Pararhizobium mangrovi TaxID=2590452 RepID=A0A506TZR5_9HYPH|nr:phosphoribosylformylglycinamidine synthase subunit PurL [Pararhizobium mangrovi]TPW26796.1 phosphoribosylformylglycinamidine synthase subunit PurL [Pararhizobium mangrovi]
MPIEPEITEELVAGHGLTPEEFDRALELAGRDLTFTELGIVSAMWNEHCSYKSSKRWLRTLPTTGPRVIQGPGENAGVVDIGDGDCVVFKMESHNHPSYIEPYQGAATGIGGILRDIFTMGARPIASMNALRFGAPDHPKTRHLVSGVVAGIGGYANAFGVPTVGGELEFDERYNGNILVNAFAAGLAKSDAIFTSKAEGVGLPVVYLGAKTGRDGVGGATMASAEFDSTIEEKRPTVQVGDPFTEKCLLEACLELMASGAVIAIQDMGAAGLTCSAVEMGAKGDLGIRLDLDRVPVREADMSAYEMMLSETQERMLMVLRPEKEAQAQAIFRKWGLDFAIVGETTDDQRFSVVHGGETVADLPIRELGDAAPEYDRHWREPGRYTPIVASTVEEPEDYRAALLAVLGAPSQGSARWVWEQYDTMIQGNTVERPGGDAGIVRVEGHPRKALAFTCDVNPRYCEADPYEGGKQAVAECWRNLTAVGADPLAVTDNLNFGDPENPEIMGQLVKAIEGIAEACSWFEFPVVSGNVSLYNQTEGRSIPPTPVIAGVGLVPDWRYAASAGGAKPGDHLVLLGHDGDHLGASAFLRVVQGLDNGPPPSVDLAAEWRNGEFVRSAIRNEQVTACHDLSSGGLAIAMAELALASGIGLTVRLDTETSPLHAQLFGEDQARYLVTVPNDLANFFCMNAEGAGVPFRILGTIGGDALVLEDRFSIPLDELRAAHEDWLPNYMDGNTAPSGN